MIIVPMHARPIEGRRLLDLSQDQEDKPRAF